MTVIAGPGDEEMERGPITADDVAGGATPPTGEVRLGPRGLLSRGGASFRHSDGGVVLSVRGRTALKTVALLVLAFAASGVAWAALAYLRAPIAHPTTNAQPDLGSQATHAAVHLPVEAVSPQGCAFGPPTSALLRLPIESARGHPGVKGEVALTFDDGPSPIYTPQVLAALQAAGAHATFFVVGRRAQQYPDLVRAEWLAGDAIGNHTFSHTFINRDSPDQVRADLSAATAAVRIASDDSCVWLFRPPWGLATWSGSVAAIVHDEGLIPVTWDIDSRDWERPGASVIAQRVTAWVSSGDIVILHDSAPPGENPDRSQTVAALPAILARLRARGLHTVTLPKLLSDAGLIRPAHPPSAPLHVTPGWLETMPVAAGELATSVACVERCRRRRRGPSQLVTAGRLRTGRVRALRPVRGDLVSARRI